MTGIITLSSSVGDRREYCAVLYLKGRKERGYGGRKEGSGDSVTIIEKKRSVTFESLFPKYVCLYR